MEWEEDIERYLEKNLADFLYDQLSDIKGNDIMVHKSHKFMALLDKLSSKIRCDMSSFIKVRSASIIDEEAENIKSEAISWFKD